MPAVKDFPVSEDDRTMNYLRIQKIGIGWKHKRQASPSKLDDGIERDSDGGIGSDDEVESSDDEDEAKFLASGSVTSAPTDTLALPLKPSSTLITSSTSTRPRHRLSPTPTPTNRPTSAFDTTSKPTRTEASIVKTRPHTTLSHGATVALEVVGIGAGVAILLGICFLLYRRCKRKQTATSGIIPQASHSFWGSRKHFWGVGSSSANTAPSMTPAGLGIRDGNNALHRQERLGLVRTSLLGEKELNGGLLGKGNTVKLNSGNGLGVPRKVVLKRNTEGRLVVRSERGLGLDVRGNAVFEGSKGVDIEASGGWEEARTVARASLSTTGPVPGMIQEAGNVANAVGMRQQAEESEKGSSVRGEIADADSERGSERGSVRRDRARERESKVSLARWRDPVSWVKDQVERRNGGVQRSSG